MNTRRMATPRAIRYVRFRPGPGSVHRHAKAVRFERHQGCIWTAIAEFVAFGGVVVAVLVVLATLAITGGTT